VFVLFCTLLELKFVYASRWPSRRLSVYLCLTISASKLFKYLKVTRTNSADSNLLAASMIHDTCSAEVAYLLQKQ
jgi:hypothetical protein